MIKTIIVEDEERNVDVLKNLLQRYCPHIEVISVTPTVQLAIEAIEEHSPDLVFLDVELPDGTGFNVIEKFPNNPFNVVFVTAYQHYAIKAIKASALDYLLKPIDIDELVSAVSKMSVDKNLLGREQRNQVLLNNYKQKNKFKQKIALPTVEGLIFVQQEDIVMCTAEGSYTNFLLKTGEQIMVSKPLHYFEDILDEEQFYRTHQSFLVNVNYIKKYIKGRGGYLVMNNGTKVEVSARLKTAFLDKFIK